MFSQPSQSSMAAPSDISNMNVVSEEIRDIVLERMAYFHSGIELFPHSGDQTREPLMPLGPPLMFCAMTGNYTCAKLLLAHSEAHQFVSTPDQQGRTALHVAAGRNWLDICKSLVDLGAKVDARDQFGSTALSQAVTKNNEDIVEFLLERGADIRYTDTGNGKTLLHIALFTCGESVVELLLEHGADMNTPDDNGDTPIELAILWGLKTFMMLMFGTGRKKRNCTKERRG